MIQGVTINGYEPPVGDVMTMVTDIFVNNPELVDLFNDLYSTLDDCDASDGDIDVSANYGSKDFTLYRLREGIERFVISDINNPAASAMAQSEIPVSGDWISTDLGQEFNHAPGGCNFLFMDGHVEFIRYPDKFPVNPTMAVLQSEEVGTMF
jgi:prepilin-type processing-associated H-X9-DG protein